MDHLIYKEGAYYVFDRGYVDFPALYTITQRKAFFVIRAKSSLKYRRVYSGKVDKSAGVSDRPAEQFLYRQKLPGKTAKGKVL